MPRFWLHKVIQHCGRRSTDLRVRFEKQPLIESSLGQRVREAGLDSFSGLGTPSDSQQFLQKMKSIHGHGSKLASIQTLSVFGDSRKEGRGVEVPRFGIDTVATRHREGLHATVAGIALLSLNSD